MPKSEVASFRREQASQEQSAQLGLFGLAIVASHESITARMEIGAERILQLVQEGKHEEAMRLMNSSTWGIEDSDYTQVMEKVG